MKLKTVKEMYNISKEIPTPLLSNFDADFWQEYKDNYAIFDKFYMHLYKTFEYANQDDENMSDSEVQSDFTQDVYMILMKNSKKYAELWRVATIPDDEGYALQNNYDIHETYSGTNASQGSAITGQRTDVTIDETGAQTSSGLNKITGWDSAAENTNNSNTGTIGNREDTHQFTKGQEQDTSRTAGQDAHTLRRYGNAGVMTVDDILRKHVDFWQLFDFYQLVFNDICSELLLIGGECIWQ